MSEEYIFKVNSRKIETYNNSAEEKITIKAHNTKFKATNFYISLNLNKYTNIIHISQIDLKIGVSWQDIETLAYLKGYFGFTEDKEITKALSELKNAFNGEPTNIDVFEPKWQEFHLSFIKWYKDKLKLCLEKELDLYKMYFEE